MREIALQMTLSSDFDQLVPQTEGLTLFYGHKSGPTRFFSNFFQSEFTDPNLYPGLERLEKWRKKDGTVTFQHVEQYMHALKAILFADFNTMDKIMEEGANPVEAKRLGREVEGYVEEVWQSWARWVVAKGILLKFSQNKELMVELAGTGQTMLVECAPRDQRWGISQLCSQQNKQHIYGVCYTFGQV